MKRILKKLLLITVLLVAVGMMLGASNAAEAKSKKLKTKTIKAGKSVNLRVKGEANWAISNTQVARMTVLSANMAKITGLQKGKTKVTAKVDGTLYKATIKVKASAKTGGNSSSQVEGLSSAPVPGSMDTVYYLNTGQEVVGHFDDAFANSLIAQTNSYRSSNGCGSLGGNSGACRGGTDKSCGGSGDVQPYEAERTGLLHSRRYSSKRISGFSGLW